MSKKITELGLGTPSDTSLGFIGDPSNGALSKATYLTLKGYFLSGSSINNTGSFATTASFNSLSSSYHNDSASFHTTVVNTVLSQSGFVQTSSYLPVSSSISNDSSSFDARIKAISGSMLTGSFVTQLNFNIYSASATLDSSSFNIRINNVFSSESNFLPTSSFNTFSASFVGTSGSINNSLTNIFASESGYVQTASFNSFSGSNVSTSSSFNNRINNTFASESNYVLTSSIQGNNSWFPVFSGSSAIVQSIVFQSGSSILINKVTGIGGAALQVAGDASFTGNGYLQLPGGTTIQRPSGSNAAFPMVRGNSDSGTVEYYNGSTWITFGVSSGSAVTGSVTSVGLTLPSNVFGVANSPIIGAGTLSGSFVTQSANTFFSGPSTASGTPSFRPLVIADIAALTSSFIGNFVLTSSYVPFSASYVVDSGSFNIRLINTLASESNFLQTSSFTAFSSSYVSASASLVNITNNVFASESNYLPTASFNSFSASYVTDSGSSNVHINNVFASQSQYLLTSSIKGTTGFQAVFNGPNSLTSSMIFQSGSSTLVGNTTGSNAALLQIFGGLYISGSIYDSTNSTGSSGQTIVSTGTGTSWVSTGSGFWSLSGNAISSGSFIGTTNAQDLIFKRNNIQIALFTTNNNVVLGNSNNTVSGSNSFVGGGSNNTAGNMSSVINGANNIAQGNSSVVIGGQNNISTGASTVILGGSNLSSSAAFSVVLGRFNDPISSSNQISWIGGDPLLTLGNGSSTSSLSNALVVYKTGSLAFPFYASSSLNVLSVDNNGYLNNIPFYSSSSINADSSSFNSRILSVSSSLFSDINGTTNFLPVFNGSHSIGNSIISQNVSNIIISGSLLITGSLANGNTVTASGLFSHAEGVGTVALGSFSHAEGNNTTSSAASSHAEGVNSLASGLFSHAEGNGTIASGLFSHAEGQATIAFSGGSHAEGFSTLASASYSHAEGNGTIASASYSHAQGQTTIAQGIGSHAEGVGTVALGSFSHAEGNGTISAGQNQSVVGSFNNANTSSLFIIGNGINDSNRSDLVLFNLNNIVFKSDLLVTGSIHISSSIYDSFGSTGSAGQILSAVTGGIQWINVSGSSGINGFVTNGVFGTFTSSYISDSGSFNTRLNNISSSLTNLTGYYVTTSSFNSYTASTSTQIANVFASESNFLPTSSIVGATNYIPVFNGIRSLSTSSLFQSGSSLLIGNATGSNNSLLQVFGNIYISKSLFDSVVTTGSVNQVLTSTANGVKWATTGSGGGLTPGVLNFIIGDTGSFTPLSGSTQFSASGNPLINRSILQFWQEGGMVSPISRSVAWYAFTSSNGIINLNNATFDQDTYYSILYV